MMPLRNQSIEESPDDDKARFNNDETDKPSVSIGPEERKDQHDSLTKSVSPSVSNLHDVIKPIAETSHSLQTPSLL